MNTDTEEDSVVIYKNDKNGNQLATVNRYEIPSDKKDSTYVDIDVTLGDNRLNENVVNHYNALNQLTQTLTENYKVSFTYDAEGLRTSKIVNGEKTVFVWDGDQLVMELSESGKVQKRYIRGNDLVYADKGENTEKKYYVTDPHGNVVQLTDESGKVTKIYEYDFFGNEVNSDRKDDNPFRYCGEYYDKETEEIYLRARYYQPEVGRFLTRDTYTGESDEPLSLHLYTYCENDGVNAWDPSGHDSYLIFDKDAEAGDPNYSFRDEANIVYHKLEKKKRNTPIHYLEVSSAKDFENKWNNYVGKRIKNNKPTRKKVKIEQIYFIFHGSIGGEYGNATGYMAVNFQKKNETKILSRNANFKGTQDIVVSDLKRKKIKKMTFSCCNTANPDCANIANAFIKRMKKIDIVIGFDGGAYFDYEYGEHKLKKGNGPQPTWNKYVPKRSKQYKLGPLSFTLPFVKEPIRERMGMRTYKNGNWSSIKYK